MAGHIALSASLDWLTPQYILERIRKLFGGVIWLDPCSNEWSKVCAKTNYRLPQNDGLIDGWDYGTIFVNPPYGRCHMHKTTKVCISAAEFKNLSKEERKQYRTTTIKDWMKRCADAYDNNSEVIALIPAAVDTKHWHKIIFKTASCVLFFEGRVKFELPDGQPMKNAPPMATALVYWGDNHTEFENIFKDLGQVIWL